MHSLVQLNDLSDESLSYGDELSGNQLSTLKYRFNGLVSTSDNVYANIERLAASAGAWVSNDPFTGQWDLVLNRVETPIAHFDDSRIIGTIQLATTPLTDMFNSVEVRFPHSELNDTMDFVRITLPPEWRLPNEQDHTLQLTYDLISDPVQAQYLGFVELKQSRLDKVITFRADYSYINIQAGAVIEVTSGVHNWQQKTFRIIRVSEITEDATLTSEIVAIEYDTSIYSTNDLYKYIRSNDDGLLSIGAIGEPDIPQVTKFEQAAVPRVVIQAYAPSGIVHSMEFWVTNDVSLDEDLRKYRLLGSRSAKNGENYSAGDEILFEANQLAEQNFLVKVRGTNGTTTGPYSEPSGLIEFVPVQTTDAIGPTTDVKDDEGNSLLGLAGANLLMKLLSELLGNGSRSAADVIAELIKNGVADSVSDPDFAETFLLNQGFMISTSAGQSRVDNIPANTDYAQVLAVPFIPKFSGRYLFSIVADQNTSRSNRDIADTVAVLVELYHGSTLVKSESSGGYKTLYWNDWAMSLASYLDAGEGYSLVFSVLNETALGNDASVTFNWNVYTVQG